MSCTCEECGIAYKVDLMIPDDLWNKIRPNSEGSGLLCAQCIGRRLESLNEYTYLLTQPQAEKNKT